MRTQFSHHVEREYDPGVASADPEKQEAEGRATAEIGMVEMLGWTPVKQAFLAEVRS
jgi:hypothetical protein